MTRRTVFAATLAIAISVMNWAHGDGPLVFEHTAVDLGVFRANESTQTTVALLNQGAEDVRILRVKTSCGCTDAKIEPVTISPGGKAALSVTVEAGLEAKNISVLVTYETPSNQFDQLLLLRYGVSHPGSIKVSPPTLDLTFDSEREALQAEVEVKVSKTVFEHVLNRGSVVIASTPAWLSLGETPAEPAVQTFLTEADKDEMGAGLDHWQLHEYREVYTFHFGIDETMWHSHRPDPRTGGELAGAVRFQTGFPYPYDAWVYSCTVHVPPALAVRPESVIFDFRGAKGENTSATARLRLVGMWATADAYSHLHVVSDSDDIKYSIVHENEATWLDLVYQPSDAQARRDGALRVMIPDEISPWELLIPWRTFPVGSTPLD